MRKDKKTRNKTAPGEKPKPDEYFVALQLGVEPTTVSSHGHALGTIVRIMRHYCAKCTAGIGMCYHKAEVLWM